jgi:hypothetical protein
MEDLVETLSNHVFLDRKPNGNIGFVNDFIFGLLVGENLILKKYEEYYPQIDKILPQDFSYKAIQSFKIQSKERRLKLWYEFNSKPFDYDAQFFFSLDYTYLGEFKRDYKNLYIDDIEINNALFSSNFDFVECNFSNITFNNCTFNLSSFSDCNFYTCSFYNCTIEACNSKKFNDFAVFACNSNNEFLKNLESCLDQSDDKNLVYDKEKKELSDITILGHFFGIGNLKPRARKISQLKESLEEYSNREINKILSSLKSNGYLHFKDNVGFITKQGIIYFNQNKTQL